MKDSVGFKQMTQDLSDARANPSFDVKEMTAFFWGSSFLLREKVRPWVENEPLFDQSDFVFKSRQEQMSYALKVAQKTIEISDRYQLDREEQLALLSYVHLMTPLSLHYTAFIPVIEAQGTPEQIERFVLPAKRHTIIGCYAQTELSHGSNVAGLKTTATLDKTTDEFVIHSPDLTASKWWIGGLGMASTHAAVQAQLVIEGQSFGPHLFIVPIRSRVDLTPLPGVTVGDIGPKAYGGFAGVDNGFVLFDQVRIPRENMLMRFSQVNRQGDYQAPVHSKLSYGSMVKIRVDVVLDAVDKLAKAVTIGVRYCTVRRQFGGQEERQVISYSSVQHRLIPLVALSYVLQMAAQELKETFEDFQQQLMTGDTHRLPEIHASSCALKSWASRQSSDGIEHCRKALGGHGFSAFSGLSHLFATFVPANTYEGDNYVLAQQVARFLLKQLQKPEGFRSASYLTLKVPTLSLHSSEDLLEPATQLKLFELRSLGLVHRLARRLSAGTDWSRLNMDCWQIQIAHAEYLVVRSTLAKLKTAPKPALAKVLKRLLDMVSFMFVSTINLC
ncbi:acyl-CoA dehydrogenase/oxidase [Sporodiniella umbellata]|nr:acyl-CoA dehydrogenase/oxidase [Sporodiniella umbellata]